MDAIYGLDSPADVMAGIRVLEDHGNAGAKAVAFAEAKLRSQVRRLPSLPQVERPSWLQPMLEIAEFARSQPRLDGPSVDLLETTERLIRCALHLRDAKAQLEFAGRGCLEVVWDNDLRLRWLVQPKKIAWPGVKVLAFRAESVDATSVEATGCWTAHTLLEHFAEAFAPADPSHSPDG